MMLRPKHIYVAGPYTNPDPVNNTGKAIRAGHLLLMQGFIPFIPHLTLQHPQPIEVWYHYDNEWLKKCDALIRLPGDSDGADDEVALMRKMERPVFTGETTDVAINALVIYSQQISN